MTAQPHLKQLAVTDLRIDNIRSDYGDLTALAATFQDNQPDAPPVVHRNKDGYVVEEGNRRVRAAQEAGIAHLWCVVRPAPPKNLQVRQLIADLQHKSLSPLERAGALAAILKQDASLSQVDLAAMLGRSTTEISQTLALLQLCKKAQQALQTDSISEGIAELLLPLPKKAQARVLPTILKAKGTRSGKPTVGAARNIIREAMMTDQERQDRDDAALAHALRNLPETRRTPPDAFFDLTEDPKQTVHLLMLYEAMRAEGIINDAWDIYSLRGCSDDLRQRLNRCALRIIAKAQAIEEATR